MRLSIMRLIRQNLFKSIKVWTYKLIEIHYFSLYFNNESVYQLFILLPIEKIQAEIMSFSDHLLAKYKDLFTKATTHDFTTELCKGTLPDEKLLLYLIQDLKFFNVGIRLTCKLASLCDSDESQIKLAKQIGFFANNENDYFQICIRDLSKTVDIDQSIQLTQVETYVAYLKNLLKSNSYTYKQLVTAHYLMEEVYLKWADDAIDNKIIPDNIEWKHKEWIDLHSGEGFSSWVKFLKDEVDRVGDETCEQIFVDMCKLEFEFFDACYSHKF